METPGIEVKYPRTDQAFGMAYHNISPTHGEGWEDFSASIEGEMQKLEGELLELTRYFQAIKQIVYGENHNDWEDKSLPASLEDWIARG